MNNIQIKTKVITNRILIEIRELTGKTMEAGVIAGIVRKILSDESELEALSTVWWDELDINGVCAFTPEQLLELAPHGFNACPIERFVSGEVDLEHAIGFCFQQTFDDAWSSDSWETGEGLEKFDFDLFQVSNGNYTGELWLATDKEGNALCDMCPECRGKACAGDDLARNITKFPDPALDRQVKN